MPSAEHYRILAVKARRLADTQTQDDVRKDLIAFANECDAIASRMELIADLSTRPGD